MKCLIYYQLFIIGEFPSLW